MCMFYPLPVLYPLFYILILSHDHKLHNIIFAPFLGSPGTDDLSVDLQELNKLFQIISLFVVEFVSATTRVVLFSCGVK
jgi:hypothetical protein